MIKNWEDFFTSGWSFSEAERDLKSKVQMINVALILSSFALLYGIVMNYFRGIEDLIALEFLLLGTNTILFFSLRSSKKYFSAIANAITVQFSFFFLYLVYTSDPLELKHIWIFTYPIVLLYFQNEKNAFLWVLFMISGLLVAPLQHYVDVKYTLYQVSYIVVVLLVVSMIIYFYQKKINEAKLLILSQQDMLKKQIEELTYKDKLLTAQSKQAVMGEMISMIAHQWRQPLSSITLNISNMQVKKLLGEKIDDTHVDEIFDNINETVRYLSETIDDFQTYFHPRKELRRVEIGDLVHKAVNFALPKMRDTHIKLQYKSEHESVVIETYANELIQVFLNIINNAVDALVDKGVQNPYITIGIKNLSQELVISLSDNAGGISKNNIEKIFEPYFSTKGKNGTGLGLYMSQMIMQKQFNSYIEVQTDSKGSTFHVKVPKKLA